VYGTKLGAHFIDKAGLTGRTVYASGSMPDGTDFAVSYDSTTEHSGIADYVQGWNNVSDPVAPNTGRDPTVRRDGGIRGRNPRPPLSPTVPYDIHLVLACFATGCGSSSLPTSSR
jgi:hypothetical protein